MGVLFVEQANMPTHPLKLFFNSRRVCITSSSDADSVLVFLLYASNKVQSLCTVHVSLSTYRISGLSRRMNGFHCFSSPIVVRPVVISFSSTSFSSRLMASLFGSTDLANARLPLVYS